MPLKSETSRAPAATAMQAKANMGFGGPGGRCWSQALKDLQEVPLS